MRSNKRSCSVFPIKDIETRKTTIRFAYGQTLQNNSLTTEKKATKEQIDFRTKIIQGYAELIQRYVDQGWKAYLVTFMFISLPGGNRAIISQMTDDVTRVYSTFITRVVRNPHSPFYRRALPVLVGCSDSPVAKRKGQSLASVAINDGLHFHAILLVPGTSRLKQGVKAHFRKCASLYLKNDRPVREINVRKITSNLGFVVDYALKAFKRGKVDRDHVLVLPRAESEFS